MKTSESIKSISAALAAVQSKSPGVGKSGNNTYDKYAYAMLEDYVRTLRPLLSENGLAVLTSVDSTTPDGEPRKNKNGGNEYHVCVSLTMRVVHVSGEWIEVECKGEGQDRADKSTYKAITGARKYGLACLFGLATTDDPEQDTEPAAPSNGHRPTPAKSAEPTNLRELLVKEVREWSGVAPEDLRSALATVKAACGVTSDKATEPELSKMVGWVRDQVKAGRKLGDKEAA